MPFETVFYKMSLKSSDDINHTQCFNGLNIYFFPKVVDRNHNMSTFLWTTVCLNSIVEMTREKVHPKTNLQLGWSNLRLGLLLQEDSAEVLAHGQGTDLLDLWLQSENTSEVKQLSAGVYWRLIASTDVLADFFCFSWSWLREEGTRSSEVLLKPPKCPSA